MCWTAVLHVFKNICLVMSKGSLGYFIVFVSPVWSVVPFDTYIVDAQRFKLWLLIIYKLISPSVEKYYSCDVSKG